MRCSALFSALFFAEQYAEILKQAVALFCGIDNYRVNDPITDLLAE